MLGDLQIAISLSSNSSKSRGLFFNTPLALRPTDLDELPMQRHRLLLRAPPGAGGRVTATANGTKPDSLPPPQPQPAGHREG